MRKFTNKLPDENFDDFMRRYFAREEICECGKCRKDHTFVKEITDYVCELIYRCPDGKLSHIFI